MVIIGEEKNYTYDQDGLDVDVPLKPVALPYAKTLAALGRHGKAGRGRGDPEITFEPDTIAAGWHPGRTEEAGVTCIGFERPLYDEALRRARALPVEWGVRPRELIERCTARNLDIRPRRYL
jgi:hypothetical protein